MAQYAKARVPQLPLTNFAAHRSPATLAARYVTRKGTDLRLASARPLSPGSASPAGVPVLYCHRRPKGFSAHTTIDDVALAERASISLHRQLRSAVWCHLRRSTACPALAGSRTWRPWRRSSIAQEDLVVNVVVTGHGRRTCYS